LALLTDRNNTSFWSASSTATNQLEPRVPARKSAAATSARKHAKLRGLNPGSYGAAPPPPPPVKRCMSPSSETKGAVHRAWRRHVVGVRNALGGVGSARHPAARLQRIYENGVGEVHGKEEGEGRKKHGPACVHHRAHSSQPRAGSVSGSNVGSSGPGARTGSVESVGGFWTASVCREGKYTPRGRRRVRRGIASQGGICTPPG